MKAEAGRPNVTAPLPLRGTTYDISVSTPKPGSWNHDAEAALLCDGRRKQISNRFVRHEPSSCWDARTALLRHWRITLQLAPTRTPPCIATPPCPRQGGQNVFGQTDVVRSKSTQALLRLVKRADPTAGSRRSARVIGQPHSTT